MNLTPSSGVLTFTTVNWETAQDVTVKAGNDADTVNDTVTLTHAATSSDSSYSGIPIASVTVTVNDNDTASDDATLSGLTVNDGTNDLTLTPTFASGTYAYAADVGNGVTTVTLTAMVNHTGASISGVTLGGTAITDTNFTNGITVPSLVEGDNVIVVEVTAQDTTTMETYEVTVTRSRRTTTTPAAPPEVTVPNDWSLIPAGVGAGAKFRLIFLSSTKSNATSYDIADYNTFIQGRAAAGHTDIQTYSSGFRAVGCTADSDARDNTGTTGTGVVIYWLGGNKAADNYGDFYDGSWDDEANDKNELGANGPNTNNSGNWPFTGCDDDGTEDVDGGTSYALGESEVRVARPDSSAGNAGPLTSNSDTAKGNTRPMYGLSQVFEVAASTNSAPTFDDGTSTSREFLNESIGDATADAVTRTNIDQPVTATDTDAGDTLEYGLEGTDAGKFTIDTTSGQIMDKAGENYDYEAKASYSVTVTVGDGNGGSDTIAVTLNILDQDEAPLEPDAPTVSAASGSTTSLDVMWTAPPNTGRPPITGYSVQSRVGSSGPWISQGSNIDPRNLSTTLLDLSEATEYQVQVRATNDEGNSDWSQSGTGTTGTPATPTVSISADKTTAVFKEDGITYTLTRSGSTTGALAVSVTLTQTKSFLATTELTKTVTIAVGQSTNTFTVAASSFQHFAAGTTVEGGTLTATVQDGTDYDLGATSSVDVAIVIGVTVRFDQASYSVSEAAGTFSFKVIGRTRPGAPKPTSNSSAMQFVFTDGTAIENTDYHTIDNLGVLFGPSNYFIQSDGVWQGEDTFGISVTDDDLDEDDETFLLELEYRDGFDHTPLVDASGNSCGSVCTVTVTITDDDTAGVTVSKSALTVTEEDTTGDTYTVVLDTLPTASVVVTVAGHASTEVTPTPTTLTFTSTTWNTPQPVTVTVNDNDTANNAPTFPSSTADRSVAENTAAGQNVGAVLTATDSDGDTLTYTLEGTDAASFDLDTTTTAGSARIQTKTGVTYNHEAKSTYTVVVKADDGNGGTDTITVTITVTDVTEAPGKPDPPTVTATSGTTDSLDVSWNAPTNTGPAIDNYDLRYKLQGSSGGFTNGPQNVTGQSASISSLDPGTEYAVQVRATSNEGNSEWSTGGRGTTRGAVTVRFEQGTYSATEGGSVTVKVLLSADPERSFTIPIEPANQGGATNSDYSIDATAVAFNSGDMEVTFGVSATQDSIDDDGESVKLSFGTFPAGVTAGSPDETTVSITDNDTAGVTVSKTSLTVTEQEVTGDTYTVVLDTLPTANVTVTVTGHSGTDVNLTPSSGVLTFTTGNWETAQDVTVTAGNDADTVNDTVTLTHSATSSDGSYSGITIADVDVTVEDDDTAQVTGLMVEPGNAQLVVQWTAVGNATGYEVQWKSGGQSYNNSRRAVVTPGTTTSHTITSLTNGTEYTVRVRATRAGANDGPYSAEVMETPVEPTAPGVTVSTMALTVMEQDTTGDTYTVVLDTEPTASVVVTVTGHASTDVNLTPSSGVLTFTTGNWGTAQDVTVKAGDDVDTTNDTVTLTHAATGSDTDYSGITIADVVVTVEDNDTAQVTGVMVEPGNAQLVVQWEEVGNATGYQVQWKSGGQSYNNSGRQATITSGTTISHTIPSLTNGTEYTVRVRATRTGANEGPYSAEEMGTPEVPTAAGVTVSKTSVTVTEQDTTGDTYTMVLDTLPTGDVVVTVAGHAGTDVTAAPTPLTFTSTTWSTAQEVTVTAGNDANTADETVSLTHSAASSDGDYQGITIAGVTVTVNDNDTGNNPPVFSQGTSTTLSFSGAAGNVGAVTAGDADGDTLTYSLGGTHAGKFSINPQTGQISTGANETYTPGDVYTVTVTADDGEGGTDTIDVTIRVRTVTPPPPANGSPEFGASSATRSMEETVGDAGAETAVMVGAPVRAADPEGDTIKYSLGGTDGDKFDIDGNTGQILGRVGERYDHEEKQSYEVTVSASDGEGGADTIEVTINIDNVSEAPEAPGALRVRASGMTALGVTWSAPRNAGRPGIEGYDLRYRNKAETEWSDGPSGVEETETDVPGLLEDTEYEVQVRAVNAEGAGEWSQAASGRTGVQSAGVAVAWLGRFGRTVAEHVLSGVSARITALRSSGMKAALGGLDLFPVESPDEPEHEDREEFGDWFGEEEEDSFRFLTMAGNDIKTRSSFVLGRSSGGGFGAVWGSGAFGGFNGRESGVSFEGDVRTGMLGADYAVGGLVGGVALSRSVGEGSYRNGRGSGKVKSSVTGIYPYAGNELSEKFSVWAVAGYGRGEMKVTLPGDGESRSADIYMKMAAAGARGDLVSGADEAGIGVSVEMDTLFVRTTSDGGRGIEAVEADVSRVRLGVEGSLGHALGDGGMLRPLIEAGIRRDGGDAETGFGADLGAGLQFSDTSGELSMQIMGRTLVVHEAGGFQDWGVSGSIRYDPYPDSPPGIDDIARSQRGRGF